MQKACTIQSITLYLQPKTKQVTHITLQDYDYA